MGKIHAKFIYYDIYLIMANEVKTLEKVIKNYCILSFIKPSNHKDDVKYTTGVSFQMNKINFVQ